MTRTLFLLGCISLFNDMASEWIYAILPIYLLGLGAGPKILGLIEGLAESTSAFVKWGSGILSDRQKQKKPWLWAGYGTAAILRPLYSLVSSWPLVMTFRFMDRIGKGLRSAPRDALLAISTAPEKRGFAFGFHRSMDHLGAFLGPLIGAAFLACHMSFEQMFLLSGFLGGLCVILITFLPNVKEVPKRKAVHLFRYKMEPGFKSYLGALFIFGLGNASNMFLLAFALNQGHAEFEVPLFWSLMAGIAAFSSTPLSSLSDRFGRVHFLLFGWFLYAAVYLGFGLGWKMWVMFAFYGLVIGATEGIEKAFVSDLVPAEKLGWGFGWYHFINGLSLLPASLIFGWLWESQTPKWAFGFSVSCVVLACLLLGLKAQSFQAKK